ncbi:adenylate kinase family protein [Candidatus Woesearchaeota archaeon]|nr:adenylate kinase family protein [Candidatus Woesearchaeota archaeon]
MYVICVTGTPGAGKTTLAKKLAKQFSFTHIDLTELIKRERLHDGYDKTAKCYDVDTARLGRFIKQHLTFLAKSASGVILDGHLSHYLSPKSVDLCIVVKASLPSIRSRLKKRGYADSKIQDNLFCEAVDLCYAEALESGHAVLLYSSGLRPLYSEIRRYLAI